jgi:hypothetical protein
MGTARFVTVDDDWESQNIRWSGARSLAVHDWGSVIAQPETAIVGLAAAV